MNYQVPNNKFVNNARPNPTLYKKRETPGTTLRIIQASIPFFYFHRPLAKVMNLTMASTRISILSYQWVWGDKREAQQVAKQELTLMIAIIGLGMLRPKEGLVFSQCMTLYQSALQYKENKLSFTDLLIEELPSFFQVASIYYPRPALLAALMILEALKDSRKGYEELRHGNRIEAFSHLILFLIRCNSATNYSLQAYRDYCPPAIDHAIDESSCEFHDCGSSVEVTTTPINQEEFDKLFLDKKLSSGKLTLGEKLDEANYSRMVEGIDASQIFMDGVSIDEVNFKHVTFSGYSLKDTSVNNRPFIRNTSFQSCQFTNCYLDEYLVENSSFSTCSFISSTFSNIDFSNVSFQNISSITTNWGQCSLTDVTWKKCSITDACIDKSTFSNFVLSDSELTEVNWYHNSLKDCYFTKSFLENCDFSLENYTNFTLYDTTILGCEFIKSSLSNFQVYDSSLIGTTFFNCNISDSNLTHCKFTKNLLPKEFEKIDCKEEKPATIVGLTWDSDNPPPFGAGQANQMKQMGAAILKVDKSVDSIDPQRLQQEIHQQLSIPTSPRGSILRSVLEKAQPGSEVFKLREIGKQMAGTVNLVVLPGGLDIEPELYGQSRQTWVQTENDWTRTILEGALLLGAEKQKIPVLGICRGEQLINVFYGGTLHQKIEGQWGVIQTLLVGNNSAGTNLIKQAIGGPTIQAYSCHSQGVNKIGIGLEKVIVHNGVTKAIVSRDKRVIGCQFHPEVNAVLSQEEIKEICEETNQNLQPQLFAKNKNIFAYMLNRAKNGLQAA